MPHNKTNRWAQHMGRVWRYGDKPRINYDSFIKAWLYTKPSVATIGRVCKHGECEMYSEFLHELNRINQND